MLISGVENMGELYIDIERQPGTNTFDMHINGVKVEEFEWSDEDFKEICELLADLNEEGDTIILVTHDQSIANQAKRTVRMLDGLIVSDEVN